MARPKSEEAAHVPAPVASGSSQVVPRISTRVEAVVPPPRVEDVGEFLLYQPAGAYTVIAGKVVPRLVKFKLQAGVNGVERDGRTGFLLANSAIDELRRNGAAVVEYDVDGPGTSYLLRHDRHPNLHHTRFEKFQPGSNIVQSDERGYAEWLGRLMADGKLPAPRLDHLEPLLSEKTRELEELEAENRQHGRIKAIRGQRDAIQKAIDALAEVTA